MSSSNIELKITELKTALNEISGVVDLSGAVIEDVIKLCAHCGQVIMDSDTSTDTETEDSK
jgi:hypothetical protein